MKIKRFILAGVALIAIVPISAAGLHQATSSACPASQKRGGHLLDLEPLWLARVDDYVAASDQLTVADLKNRKTDEANHNARPFEQILTEFRAARERLLKRVGELDASLFARYISHPRLKTPMRLADHLYFVAEHDDHHLARIWELVNAVR